MSLEAKHVTFAYRRGWTPVLRDVSLCVRPGERVGLYAPSGRGKTTLCRILAGCEVLDAGEALVDGQRVAALRGFCPVQMLWQHPETVVDPLLTLGETLGEAGAVGPAVLEALGIRREWLERYPGELSGGELQRFCIARAMRPGLRYLLCDESTAMLDPITQAQIWEFLLGEAEERQLGLLIVSHDRSLLSRLCTRMETLPE